MMAFWRFQDPTVTYLNLITGQLTVVGDATGYTADDLLYFMATEGGNCFQLISWGEAFLHIVEPLTDQLPEAVHAVAVPELQ